MTKIEEEVRAGDCGYAVGLNGVAVINNTFAQDFLIAGMFGARQIKETYDRAFKEWKSDIQMITALAIALNHLAWKYAGDGLDAYGKLYTELWRKVEDYVYDCDYDEETDEENYKHFTSEEVRYFYAACD